MLHEEEYFFQSLNRDKDRKDRLGDMNPQGYIWLAVSSVIIAILLLTGLLKYGLA